MNRHIENVGRAAAIGLWLSSWPVNAKENQQNITPIVKTAISMDLATELAPAQQIPIIVSQAEIPQNEGLFPSQVLDLTYWKVTLPTGVAGKPTEIKQPVLASYQDDSFTVVSTEQGIGVRFRAGVNGVTTSGSRYPRSELREMTEDGKRNASWSSLDGTHIMFLDQAITAVPKNKPHVVAGQIHDASNFTVFIRLEGSRLFVNYTDKQGRKNQKYPLTNNYMLGERFQIQMTVSGGQTEISYRNGVDEKIVFLSTLDSSELYFKAGAYTQSNCVTEGLEIPCDDTNNYGEAVIYNATLTHRQTETVN